MEQEIQEARKIRDEIWGQTVQLIETREKCKHFSKKRKEEEDIDLLGACEMSPWEMDYFTDFKSLHTFEREGTFYRMTKSKR